MAWHQYEAVLPRRPILVDVRSKRMRAIGAANPAAWGCSCRPGSEIAGTSAVMTKLKTPNSLNQWPMPPMAPERPPVVSL